MIFWHKDDRKRHIVTSSYSFDQDKDISLEIEQISETNCPIALEEFINYGIPRELVYRGFEAVKSYLVSCKSSDSRDAKYICFIGCTVAA